MSVTVPPSTPALSGPASPGEDQRNYRRALGHFATGVTIVTAQAGGQLAGMTANSFSSVSLDPALILWSIDKKSNSLALFQQASHFAINVLAADQMDLASRFARSGADKFAGIDWRPGLGDAPCLPKGLATFECRRRQFIDAGDHFIVLGQVDRYQLSDRDPLLFVRGRFALSADYPVVAADSTPGAQGAGQARPGTDPPTMLGLLWDAFTGLSQSFQAERDALGLYSVTQGRVLSLIERYPEANAETIARKAYISPLGLEDALQALQAGGYLTLGTDGSWLLSAKGREHVTLRRRRAAAIEASQLKSFSAAELETACRVLRSLGAALPTGTPQAAS
jgi:flavin reductase (DIM6/NTAB) family NADH-FMN oxidoreductase RutF/DNA-binding MarR family transcriptional regulator